MLEMLGTGISTMLHFIMDNIVIINIILSLIIVFFERRSPQAVWTWLLLLYFIPIVGFILYLVIGQAGCSRQRRLREKSNMQSGGRKRRSTKSS